MCIERPRAPCDRDSASPPAGACPALLVIRLVLTSKAVAVLLRPLWPLLSRADARAAAHESAILSFAGVRSSWPRGGAVTTSGTQTPQLCWPGWGSGSGVGTKRVAHGRGSSRASERGASGRALQGSVSLPAALLSAIGHLRSLAGSGEVVAAERSCNASALQIERQLCAARTRSRCGRAASSFHLRSARAVHASLCFSEQCCVFPPSARSRTVREGLGAWSVDMDNVAPSCEPRGGPEKEAGARASQPTGSRVCAPFLACM